MRNLISVFVFGVLIAATPLTTDFDPAVSQAQTAIKDESAVETLAQTMRQRMHNCIELLRSAVMIRVWPECGGGDGSAIRYEYDAAMESAAEDPDLQRTLNQAHSLYLTLAARVSPLAGEDVDAYRSRTIAAVDSMNAEIDQLLKMGR